MLTRGRHAAAAATLTFLALGLSAGPGAAVERQRGKPEKPAPQQPAPPPATPEPPPETKPYDAQLMRLAEILGALTYLRDLCGQTDASVWRGRMQALLEAEGTTSIRKDRLAGAYNKGVQGYSMFYRSCTSNAHIVIERFLAEGERIAKEIENRYRAS